MRLTTSFVSIYRQMFELRLRRAKNIFLCFFFSAWSCTFKSLQAATSVVVQWRASVSSMRDTESKHQDCQHNKQCKYKVLLLSTVIQPIDAASHSAHERDPIAKTCFVMFHAIYNIFPHLILRQLLLLSCSWNISKGAIWCRTNERKSF